MEVETTKMSSKGQVVIPQDIREEVKAGEGTVFAVIGSGDMIVLKKIEKPSKERLIKELELIAKDGRTRLESKENLLQKFREFTKDSELTEKDAVKLGRKANKALTNR